MILSDHDTAARLTRTADAVLRAHLGDSAELRAQLAPLAVRWMMATPGSTAPDRAARLRLTAETRESLQKCARSLRWMAQPSRHHGQQAADIANKALRGLRAGRLDFTGLSDLAQAFRRARQAHIRQRAQARPRMEGGQVMLAASEATAIRVTSERDLLRLGREAKNCLADPRFAADYSKELRDGDSEFWRIDGQKPSDSLLWIIKLDREDGSITEIDAPKEAKISRPHRDALLEFLASRDAVPATWSRTGYSLQSYAISSELIAATRQGTVRSFVAAIDGTDWRMDLTAGVLAAWPLGVRPAAIGGLLLRCWMLRQPHGPDTEFDTLLSWKLEPEPGEALSDEETDLNLGYSTSLPQFLHESVLRSNLRRLCRQHPHIRQACANAFAAAPGCFLEDWLGMSETMEVSQ
jgi:hypothetical protein